MHRALISRAVGLLCLAMLAFGTAAAAAPAPGPAWWRVSDADSEVWIIGVPDKLFLNLKYDETALREHLDGAQTLIVPPTRGYGFKLSDPPKRPNTPLEKRLPADIYARLLKLNPTWKVWGGYVATDGSYISVFQVAADLVSYPSSMTVSDYLGNPVAERATKLKGKAKLVTLQAGANDMLNVYLTAARTDADQLACLERTLPIAEAGVVNLATLRKVDEAWAQGDLELGASRFHPLYGCTAGANGAAYWNKIIGDYDTAIATALSQPGKSVAVVEFDPLLMPGGVLERLVARGAVIERPAGAK